MKKLISIKEFEQKNPNSRISYKKFKNVFGGFIQLTNDWCQTLDDTCTNNRSDIHHTKSIDGVVVYDHIDMEEC